jgi:cell division protein FtsQ
VLNGLPMVRSVNVSREWPDKIRVDVTERTPVAVVSIGGRLRALDETGTVFWDYKKAPAGLPKVNTVTGTNSDALREAAAVASALPADLAKRVDYVEVTTVDSISLELRSDKRVVWGSSAQSDTKADVLVALMKAEPDVARYDVSVPGQPVTSKSVD